VVSKSLAVIESSVTPVLSQTFFHNTRSSPVRGSRRYSESGAKSPGDPARTGGLRI
jgi:hypothetical protein